MIKMLVRRFARSFGYEFAPVAQNHERFPDVPESDWKSVTTVEGYTMTSVARQVALIDTIHYVAENRIHGCFVECGVWRGGSAMLAALTLRAVGDESRRIFLYDTFKGMTGPSSIDTTRDGLAASDMMTKDTRPDGVRCIAPFAEVYQNLVSTGYPMNHISLIEGPIEETIPLHAPPEPIAVLRLDTDWYESTRHELEYLYPLVAPGGIIIIDDYGHWNGSRRAVNEYLALLPRRPFLHRIDDTGRLIIKH